MTRVRPPADLAPAVLEAWRAVVAEIAGRHGEPRMQYGPTWTRTERGDGRRVGAVWFLPVAGKLINHNLSVLEFGRGPVGAAPAVPSSWFVAAGRHAGPIGAAELLVRMAPDVELLRHVAGFAGLLERAPEPTVVPPGAHGVDVGDLDAVRILAARANRNAEQLDPGAVLDIVGWPSSAGERITD